MSSALLAVGGSHRTLPLALRERIALPDGLAAGALAELGADGAIAEVAAISTCNRTELYIVAGDEPRAQHAAVSLLSRRASGRRRELRRALYVLREADAVRHLFRVAAGLESMILGEAEVQGQVRRAHKLAVAAGTAGPIESRLFQDALRSASRAREETCIGRSAVSFTSVAVELASTALGGLDGRRAVVIGTGKGGELAARALSSRGVRVACVAGRRRDRAAGLASRFGGLAASLDEVADAIRAADVVVSCTSSTRPVLCRADLEEALGGRPRRPLVVIDMAVPRDVEASVRGLPGVVLHDLDDLQRQATRNADLRGAEAALAAELVEESVLRFERWRASLELVPTIAALRERGRATVEQLLRENETRWKGLLDEDRARVELLANSVVSRMLHEPTVRLKGAAPGAAGGEYARVIRELFALPPPA